MRNHLLFRFKTFLTMFTMEWSSKMSAKMTIESVSRTIFITTNPTCEHLGMFIHVLSDSFRIMINFLALGTLEHPRFSGAATRDLYPITLTFRWLLTRLTTLSLVWQVRRFLLRIFKRQWLYRYLLQIFTPSFPICCHIFSLNWVCNTRAEISTF